jgi:hypothetical protein
MVLHLRVKASIFFRDSTALVDLGLLIVEVSTSNSDTLHLVEFSGRMIGPLQKSLPENTQHSQQTSMQTGGFEPAIPAASQLPLTNA